MSVKFRHHFQYRIFHSALVIAAEQFNEPGEDGIELDSFEEFSRDEEDIGKLIEDALWLTDLVFRELENIGAVLPWSPPPSAQKIAPTKAIPPWRQPSDEPAQPKKPRKKR